MILKTTWLKSLNFHQLWMRLLEKKKLITERHLKMFVFEKFAAKKKRHGETYGKINGKNTEVQLYLTCNKCRLIKESTYLLSFPYKQLPVLSYSIIADKLLAQFQRKIILGKQLFYSSCSTV